MMKSGKGFTLVELMLTVGVLVIISGGAMVMFSGMFEKSLEGATKANLGTLMAAVSVYYSDNPGKWPQNIADPSFNTYVPIFPAVKVKHSWSGFLLSGSATSVNLVTVNGSFSSNTDGWRYNKTNGFIWVNNSQTDTTGVAYSMYGY